MALRTSYDRPPAMNLRLRRWMGRPLTTYRHAELVEIVHALDDVHVDWGGEGLAMTRAELRGLDTGSLAALAAGLDMALEPKRNLRAARVLALATGGAP